MKTKLEKLLLFMISFGVLFSWYTIITDFIRFNNIYGTIFRIQNCLVPNPVTTPCFYGAIAFLLSLTLFLMKKYFYLKYLLIAGTIFAWGNFTIEAIRFYMPSNTDKIGCSGIVVSNIFTTPCFYGAVIYLVSLIIFLKSKKNV